MLCKTQKLKRAKREGGHLRFSSPGWQKVPRQKAGAKPNPRTCPFFTARGFHVSMAVPWFSTQIDRTTKESPAGWAAGLGTATDAVFKPFGHAGATSENWSKPNGHKVLLRPTAMALLRLHITPQGSRLTSFQTSYAATELRLTTSGTLRAFLKGLMQKSQLFTNGSSLKLNAW